MTPEALSFAEADARLDHALSASFMDEYDTVLFFPGDLTIDGDFLEAIGIPEPETDADEPEYSLIVVAGDLTVTGSITMYEYFPGLYVGGHTRAETMIASDPEIRIHDATITHLVYSWYNKGVLVGDTVDTPWLINSAHDTRITAPNAFLIDNYGDSDDADFTSGNIPESFVPEVVSGDGVDVNAFTDRLRAGLPVLLPGARTHVQQALADVARAKADHADTLDLTRRKLKEFPPDILEMPWLRTLVLDGNPIERLPDEISALTELEQLSVNDCRLTTLPDSIGELTTLEVLRIAGNIRSEGPFPLPDSTGGLRRLRTLVADRTSVVFPATMEGLPALREISLASDGNHYLTRFPDAVTTFPNLRKLDLSGNPFEEIPDSLTRLANLEELDLGGALDSLRTPLPDLSALAKLRVLDLGGATVRSAVGPHSLLRSLFAMRLDALEELVIDRWRARPGGSSGPMTPDVIAGIGAFRALKRLDLSYNGLTDLPEDAYSLPEIEWLDLHGNALDKETRQRIAASYPHAAIDFRDQADTDRRQLPVVDAVIKRANAARDRRDWATALAAYDEAIAAFADGSADSPYAQLYAHYGQMWIHGTAGYGTEGTDEERAEHRRLGVAVAQRCLELVPPAWPLLHYTDDNEFHREVVRYATNFVAWEILTADPAPTTAELERALGLIEQGLSCGDDKKNVHLRDTHARVLLALGKDDEAWRAVHRADALDPDFAPLADLKQDQRYRAWLRNLHTADGQHAGGPTRLRQR